MAYDSTGFVVAEVKPALTEAQANIARLRDFLADLSPERFSIRSVAQDARGMPCFSPPEQALKGCGTAGCIAGWAAVLSGGITIQDWLQLSPEATGDLIMPHGWMSSPEAYPVTRAVRVLDHLLATGRVDWSVA